LNKPAHDAPFAEDALANSSFATLLLLSARSKLPRRINPARDGGPERHLAPSVISPGAAARTAGRSPHAAGP
jgi:hypothetical protein